MKIYIVGGFIRDELLGLKSKDVDYAVEMTEEINTQMPADVAYDVMNYNLEKQGFKIFLKTPDCFTTRAMFPKDHEHSGVADFVMCRKELGYKEGTRKPIVEIGTIMDDLARRDFTVNAIAKDVGTGHIIDPFNGQEDLGAGILRCPVSAETSFNDDPLRIIRALRFNTTKDLVMSADVVKGIVNFNYEKMSVVSTERIMDELTKMFKYNTLNTLLTLGWLKDRNYQLWMTLFHKNDLWLQPTMKKK